MYFKTTDHQAVFNNLLERTGQWDSSEYKAAVYILSAIGKDVSEYVRPGEIKYPALFKKSSVWSSGEKALLRLSATLSVRPHGRQILAMCFIAWMPIIVKLQYRPLKLDI